MIMIMIILIISATVITSNEEFSRAVKKKKKKKKTMFVKKDRTFPALPPLSIKIGSVSQGLSGPAGVAVPREASSRSRKIYFFFSQRFLIPPR
ncbi:hypothetical protein PUN28_018666 [Cardiocondyla obscurior]|uniref:Secreted protein n=1 Tax=Cardiocondyla obscurior TaxID=286306 RepID=A0AAW2EJ54_9HYME